MSGVTIMIHGHPGTWRRLRAAGRRRYRDPASVADRARVVGAARGRWAAPVAAPTPITVQVVAHQPHLHPVLI